MPDAKTIWVWRERLKRAGFIARGGQIIDASIISAPIQRNTGEENARIKQGEGAQDWSDAKRRQKDVQARWTLKHGKAHYGYKLHANTDRRWGFIRRHEVSAANVHDSRHFETLLDPVNTGRTVRADSAYANQAREVELRRQGYRADIQHKGQADKPLSLAQQRRNHRIAKDRRSASIRLPDSPNREANACVRLAWREPRW